MRRYICVFMIMIITVTSLLSGCKSENINDSGKLKIVTTCFPPYDFARAVAGDSADITMLLSTGAEAHSYEPTPLDIAAIQNCDVFICIGGEDEVWVDKILNAVDTSDMQILRLIEHVTLLDEEPVAGASPNGHDHEHEHQHDDIDDDDNVRPEDADGHIWTSPDNAMLCLDSVKDTLCKAAPENEDFYNDNYENYYHKLQELDREFAQIVENAENNVIVIADRFPFRYLTNDYDLEYFAAFSGCSSESEPSVYTMAFLINEILEHDIDTIFYLEFSTKKLAEKLCDATGAKMLPLNSCHNVTKKDFENGVTYIDLMYENSANIKEALS